MAGPNEFTKEQYEEAIRKADAAGDTESATKLSRALQDLAVDPDKTRLNAGRATLDLTARASPVGNVYSALDALGKTDDGFAGGVARQGAKMVRGAISGITEGGMFAWDDELAGVLAGDEAKTARRDAKDAAARDTFFTNLAGNLVGGSVVPVGSLNTAGKIITVGNAARGAVGGAVAGGAFGAGDAEGDAADRVDEAKTGALYGGLAGAASPAFVAGAGVAGNVVARGAGNVTSALSDALSSLIGKQGTAQKTQAERVARAAVRRSMQRSGLTFEQIMENVRRFEDKPAVLAEVIGQDAVNALTALTRKQGTTSQRAQGLIEDRVGSFPDRARTDLETATGIPRGTLDQTLEGQITQRQEDATPIYRQLFDDFAQAGSRRLEQLGQSPTLQRHLARAQQALADAAAIRGRAPETLSRMEYWDLVKRSLDDAINQAEARGEATTRVGESVRDLVALKNAVVDELDTITNGAYAAARDVGGEAPRLREAARAGQQAFGARNPAEVARTVAETNPQDIPAMRAGMVDEIATRIDKRTLPPSQFATPDKSGKVRAVFGEEAGGQFLDRMAAEADLASMGGRWAPRANSVSGVVLENGEAQLADGAVSVMQWLSTNTLGKLDILARMMRRSGYTQQQMDAMGDLLLSNPREGLRRLGLDPDAPVGGAPAPRATPAPPAGPDEGSPPPQASPNGFNEIMSNGRTVDPTPVRSNGFTTMLRGDLGAALSGALGGGMVPNPQLEGESFTDNLMQTGGAMAAGAAAGVAARRGIGVARNADDIAAQTFGGIRAANAPREAMGEAAGMARDGASPRAQWEKTRTFVDADGRARFEIDDSGAQLRVPVERLAQGGRGQLRDIMDHPALYEAYPYLATTRVIVRPQPQNALGSYDRVNGVLELSPTIMKAGDEDNIVSVMLHEIQHGIQDLEGFANGGSPAALMARFDTQAGQDIMARVQAVEAASEAAMKAKDNTAFLKAQGDLRDLTKEARRIGKYETYKHLLGEAEARLVQTRRKMTGAERGESFPLDDLDVPMNKRTVDGKVNPLQPRAAFQTEDETAQAIEDLVAAGYSRKDAEELAALTNQLFSQ